MKLNKLLLVSLTLAVLFVTVFAEVEDEILEDDDFLEEDLDELDDDEVLDREKRQIGFGRGDNFGGSNSGGGRGDNFGGGNSNGGGGGRGDQINFGGNNGGSNSNSNSGGSSGATNLKDLLGSDGDDLGDGINTRFNVNTRLQGNFCQTPRREQGVCSYIFEPQCSSVLNRIQRLVNNSLSSIKHVPVFQVSII